MKFPYSPAAGKIAAVSVPICINCKWHGVGEGKNIVCQSPRLKNPVAASSIRGGFQTAFQEEMARASLPELCEHKGKWYEKIENNP